MEQDGGGDVVGQVAHHAQAQGGLAQALAKGLRQCREIHLEHIRLDHVELPMQAQSQGQVTVQFDDGEATQALDQGLRQGG